MILLDTSAVLAALFPDQRQHKACLRAIDEAVPPRVLSPIVLAELDYFITKYSSVSLELEFLDQVGKGVYELAAFSGEDLNDAIEIIKVYHDLNIGLADASIVVLADRYHTRDVVTLDERHFRAMRPPGQRSFRILPADA